MTEADWLACNDPSPMLRLIKDHSSDRKRRLFAVSSCRMVWPNFPNDQCRQVVNAAELFADDLIQADELGVARGATIDTLELIIKQNFEGAAWVRVAAETAMIPVIVPQLRGSAKYLRDIFGNPFRPVAFDPRWRTPDVLGLAWGIYDEMAFDRLPILADALTDAGCDNPDILTHCRSDGPHVRGCWVVDLILGKE